MNWPGRRREEGGSEHIAYIRVIQVLPVADNWIDEDGKVWLKFFIIHDSGPTMLCECVSTKKYGVSLGHVTKFLHAENCRFQLC